MRIEAPHPRGGHLLDAGVDAGDTRLPCQNRRERALAAAEIENPLVRTRREQLDHRLAQHRDETRVALVARWIPVLVDDPAAWPGGAIWLARCRHLSFAATVHRHRCRRTC